MIYNSVPNTIDSIRQQTGDSLHAMSMRANVSYSTVHAWSKGSASPNVDKFNDFVRANGFHIKIVNTI